MSKIHRLNTADCSLATARGLMQVAHFIFDNASEEDWANMRTSFGFLLNTVSTELGCANAGVDELYREHFAANDRGRAS